ncbi:hypothetical protein PoB_005958600 [Plakobranchus ocellatus]|uniref:Uncharacterized protein n=1 Tax=Plakobranchus ocellatus TaxID=259542 RepID=A0AAV4CJK4_9GAST|nr:hypothetical protein PoB_005958600 [Plakobranchus ocellatus]
MKKADRGTIDSRRNPDTGVVIAGILGNSIYKVRLWLKQNPLDIRGVTRDVAESLILCNKSTTLNATGRFPSKVNRVPEDVQLDK